MKIATIIAPPPATHGPPEVVADTVDSIETWVGDRVLVLANESAWPTYQHLKVGSAKVEQGFLYTPDKRFFDGPYSGNSPYRNAVLGLKKLYEYWPDSDWFLYSDYDCLYTSDAFKADLAKADSRNAWCVGHDLRRFDFQIPFLQSLLNCGPIRYSYYVLGCCIFLSRALVAKMHDIGFMDRLLNVAQTLPANGYFPDYPRVDLAEELWATVAVHLGGSVYELACWKSMDWQWHPRYTDDPHVIYAEGGDMPHWRGRFPVYSARWQPEVVLEETPETSIAHPVKGFDNPLRVSQRARRQAVRRMRAGALYPPRDLAAVHFSRGLAFQRQGQLNEAIGCYQQALAARPDHAEAHNNLGVIHGQQGRLTEASACFREAIRHKPDCTDAHSNLAKVPRQS